MQIQRVRSTTYLRLWAWFKGIRRQIPQIRENMRYQGIVGVIGHGFPLNHRQKEGQFEGVTLMDPDCRRTTNQKYGSPQIWASGS